jgi:hypothetical protein
MHYVHKAAKCLGGTFKFESTRGLIEHGMNVVSSVSTITIDPSLNLFKQRRVGYPLGPKKFH